jgi:hypothetical protein
MKILIAVDGSSASDATLQAVISRPWPKESAFSLVTAVDPFFYVRAPLLLEEAKKSANQELEEDAAGLRAKGWPVNSGVLLENPRHAIPKFGNRMEGGSDRAGVARAGCVHATVDWKHRAGGFATRAVFDGNCANAPRGQGESWRARDADPDTDRWVGACGTGGESSCGKTVA